MSGRQVTDDDYFLAVGKLMNNAALADAFLFSAFRVISTCDITLARAIYYTIEAIPVRANLTKRVAQVRGKPGDEEIVDEISKQAETAAKTRNKYAHVIPHGPIGQLASTYSPRLLLQPNVALTHAGLDAAIDHTAKAALDAAKAYEQLCVKHGVPLGLHL